MKNSTERASFILLCALCVASMSLIVGCQTESEIDFAMKGSDRLLQYDIDSHRLTGASFLVSRNNHILFQKDYGFAQVFDYEGGRITNPETITAEHLFDLASLTKVFATTFGAMLLVDRGELDLNAPLHDYLPLFTGVHKDSVRILHLLTHTSGLYRWQPLYYHSETREQTYRYICSLPLQYGVGKERQYSDLGFMLLGYIIEKISGQTLNEFLQQELYQPLGLKTTTFTPREFGFTKFVSTSYGNPYEYRMVADSSFGYRCFENLADFTRWRRYTLTGEVNDGNAFYANAGMAGHAGLFSTATDLDQLVRLLLNDGEIDGKRILKAETIRTFFTKDEFGNGLGWGMDIPMLRDLPGCENAFAHGGFTGTYAIGIPKMRLSMIILTNRQQTGLDEHDYYYNLFSLQSHLIKPIIEAVAKELGD